MEFQSPLKKWNDSIFFSGNYYHHQINPKFMGFQRVQLTRRLTPLPSGYVAKLLLESTTLGFPDAAQRFLASKKLSKNPKKTQVFFKWGEWDGMFVLIDIILLYGYFVDI